jgi:hypothetical protein
MVKRRDCIIHNYENPERQLQRIQHPEIAVPENHYAVADLREGVSKGVTVPPSQLAR